MDEQHDEISLIDLLIVLIRRRKIIVGMTGAALVLAVVFFYAAPALGLASYDSYTVEAVLVPVRFPSSIKDEIGMDLPRYAMSIATSPVNLIGPVWAMGFSGTKTMAGPEDPSFLSFIKREFLGRKIYTCTVNGEGGLVFSVNNENRAVAESFLKTMVGITDLKVRKEVAQRARVIADSMETVLAESEKRALPVSVEAKQMFLSSRSFTNEDAPLLLDLSGVETSRDRTRPSTGVVIMMLAGLLLGIFVAFIAEAVSNVRKDEEAMGKIREARAFGKKA